MCAGFKKLLYTFFVKLKLRFDDPQEEEEYIQSKIPLIKSFYAYLLVCLMVLAIPLIINLLAFLKLIPQGIMAVAVLAVALLIYIVRGLFGRWLEYVVIIYLLAVVIIIIINLSYVLQSLDGCEAFYGGYAFAILHRTLGYRVVKIHSMILFHFVSLVLRLIFLHDHRFSVTFMVTAVEMVTICLSVKSEIGERTLFDSHYNSKNQLHKFKDFLTEHLPNEMAIFSKDYSKTLFINKAFKKRLQCNNLSHAKDAVDNMFVEKESIDKHLTIFKSIGCLGSSLDNPLKLSDLLTLLPRWNGLTRNFKNLAFNVYKTKFTGEGLDTYSEKSGIDSLKDIDARKETTPTESVAITINNRPDSNSNKHNGSSQRYFLKQPSGCIENTKKDNEKGTTAPDENNSENSKEGMKRIFKVKIILLPWDGIDAIAIVLDDITQQRTIMELKMIDKNKDLVIAMVSHELRTPLNGMLGLIDIVKKMVKDNNIFPYLDACRNSGVFLLNLVNSILDMSQIKNNKLKLIYTKVQIPELLREVKSLFQPFCSTKGLYLNIDIQKDVPAAIMTDRSRLSQILINLIGNAFKFTFEGGVTVRVELDPVMRDRLKFSIQDTGLGIKKEDQEKLFKLFGRLEQQDKKVNASGVGLGLTISNNLVMLLNPTEKRGICVESGLGKGSTFSFLVESQSEESHIHADNEDSPQLMLVDEEFMPLASKIEGYTTATVLNLDRVRGSKGYVKKKDLPPSTLDISRPAKKLPRRISYSLSSGMILINNVGDSTQLLLNKMEVDPKIKSWGNFSGTKDEEGEPWCLIVDDNPFNLMVGSHILEEKGFRVKKALNGKEALQEVKKHYELGETFKVILMDCQMPVMNGYQATKILKEMMGTGEIGECPILALTANTRDEEHEKQCEAAGMDGCISKPLQANELEEMLHRLRRKKWEKKCC